MANMTHDLHHEGCRGSRRRQCPVANEVDEDDDEHEAEEGEAE